MSAPLSDAVVIAVSRLFDDAGATREPSHSDLEFQIRRAGVADGDPAKNAPVGKAKRLRQTLSWAIEHNEAGAEKLVRGLVALLRGCGGFRSTSQNYVGDEAIGSAIAVFRSEGFDLTQDGELRPLLLDSLAGHELTDALWSYVRRARRGAEDAALVTGTAKDLLEATAAHVLSERFGSYPQNSNFPTLLGQAFMELRFATPAVPPQPGEPPRCRTQRQMYELACAINAMRNKEGTGHGRPWLSGVTEQEARSAIELMGAIAGAMLSQLEQMK